MNKKRKGLTWKKMMITVILILVCGQAHVGADVVNFAWNPYCPYTCKPSVAGQPGYAMEIIAAIFRNSEYKAVFKEISSWNRAMQMVERGETDAIVFTFYPSDADTMYIVPEEALTISKYITFVVRKDNPWVLAGPESLESLNLIGVYKDTVWGNDSFAEFQKSNPEKFNYFHGDKISERVFKMLELGRIDAWEDAETILKYQIHKQNIKNVRLERYPLEEVMVGGALFTRKNPRSAEYAEFLSKGIRKMQESGELRKILEKYGLIAHEK